MWLHCLWLCLQVRVLVPCLALLVVLLLGIVAVKHVSITSNPLHWVQLH